MKTLKSIFVLILTIFSLNTSFANCSYTSNLGADWEHRAKLPFKGASFDVHEDGAKIGNVTYLSVDIYTKEIAKNLPKSAKFTYKALVNKTPRTISYEFQPGKNKSDSRILISVRGKSAKTSIRILLNKQVAQQFQKTGNIGSAIMQAGDYKGTIGGYVKSVGSSNSLHTRILPQGVDATSFQLLAHNPENFSGLTLNDLLNKNSSQYASNNMSGKEWGDLLNDIGDILVGVGVIFTLVGMPVVGGVIAAVGGVVKGIGKLLGKIFGGFKIDYDDEGNQTTDEEWGVWY